MTWAGINVSSESVFSTILMKRENAVVENLNNFKFKTIYTSMLLSGYVGSKNQS